MNRARVLVGRILLPALVLAALSLASWTYRTANVLEEAAARSVIDSTVLLTREKVDRVEQQIIAYDHAVSQFVNPDDLDSLATRWAEAADRVSPTVRSVLVLDAHARLVRHVSRDAPDRAAHFRTVFTRTVLPALHLDTAVPGNHVHLHEIFEGELMLVSALTRDVGGRRYFVVLQGDLDYIRHEMLPHLFDDPTARSRFNVVDDEGHFVYGHVLAGAGEFLVARTFPTTLYKWRLSVAPQAAPEIEQRKRRSRSLDLLQASLSLVVLVAGVAFLAYSARQEARLNALKSDFMATVSHELKTPLSLIRMFGEMLSSERFAGEDRRRQYLEIIVRESERLTALIENVLDFAKVERGKAAYDFTSGNLSDIVARGIELFRYRLEQRSRPELRVDLGTVPETLLDEHAIQLLLFNLLDNALKYAPEGEMIWVRTRSSDGTVTLEVEDDGPGIPVEDAKRVFDRFYRGRNASESGARGSGIGLALVQHIAQAHGGEVTVRPGVRRRGALFCVRIPVKEA